MATYRCKNCHRQDRHVVAVHDSGGRVGDRRIPAEKQWICEFFPKFGTAVCSAAAGDHGRGVIDVGGRSVYVES